MTEFDLHAELRALLAGTGVTPDDAGGTVEFRGEDPIVPSVHRLGAMSALAVMANAVAVATIWRMQTGRAQHLRVDLRQAIHGLNPGFGFTPTINGHSYPDPGHPLNPVSFYLYPTRDGRIVSPTAARHAALYRWLELLECPPVPVAVAAAIAGWNAEDLDEAAAAAHLPFSICYSPEEWLALPQGAIMADVPVVEVTKLADSQPEPIPLMERPLAGVRVLANTHAVSGSTVGRTLAEQGADVLQITAPSHIEADFVYNEANVGMRSTFLDLRCADSNRRAQQLASEADVFVENYREGAMRQYGLSREELAVRRPGMVVVSVRCYGDKGPWAERVGHDFQGSAASGLAVAEGAPDLPRHPPTMMINDFMTGYLGAAGATAALVRRAREGGSYHVKVSLVRTAMWAHSLGLLEREHLVSIDGNRPADPEVVTGSTPLGLLRRLAPAVHYSETPARWDDPLLVPRGSCAPGWRDAP